MEKRTKIAEQNGIPELVADADIHAIHKQLVDEYYPYEKPLEYLEALQEWQTKDKPELIQLRAEFNKIREEIREEEENEK